MNISKFYRLAVCAIVSVSLSSCFFGTGGGGSNTPTFSLGDLQGLWQENNTEHFVRFTREATDETGYYYGREWNEDQDIFEEDLVPYGNGWFKYELKSTGTLTEIHLMDNGGAEIPKVFVVTKLDDTTLEYYEKGYSSSKYYFSKMVSR